MPKLFEKPSQDRSEKELSENLPARELPAREISADQRHTLLRVGHEAINSYLEGRHWPDASALPTELLEPRGVFTTLYVPGDVAGEFELRGCVGYATPVAPLYRAVAETARAAAFEDSRFPPVTKDEALSLKISLSVLSRLFPIHPEAVEIGRHGLLISEEGRRGLLLPQVAVEHGWSRETFLEQTCRKAGLPLDSWRRSATLEGFTAEVFGDGDAGC